MKFYPKSENELANDSLLPAGVYPFVVIDATEKVSKSGNEMIELKLNVFGETTEHHIYDYLLEKMAYKLYHFAESTGLLGDYERGSLAAIRCEGKQGWCKIGVEVGKNGYPPKNNVADYLKAPTPAAAAPAAAKSTPDTHVIGTKRNPVEVAAEYGVKPGSPLDDGIPF